MGGTIEDPKHWSHTAQTAARGCSGIHTRVGEFLREGLARVAEMLTLRKERERVAVQHRTRQFLPSNL
jgi:hypothetical protein